MKVRSPFLGYNHNIRYGGRLYHVQTEDSGVNNPHLFTHMFYEGTILASKRSDYDPTQEDSAVKLLMQAQHKAMLTDLRRGEFDGKIAAFFGEPVGAADAAAPAESADDVLAEPESRTLSLTARMLAEALGLPTDFDGDDPFEDDTLPSTPAHPARGLGGGDAATPTPQLRFTPPVARKPPSTPARPVVVGSAPARRVAAPAPAAASRGPATPRSDSSIFGAEAEIDESLDEVILNYLSEDAPKK